MLLSMEKYYHMFENNIVRILHFKSEEDYVSVKLEYLTELRQISSFVSSIVNLDDTLQTILFPILEDEKSITINVYWLNETCDYFVMKTLNVKCQMVIPIDKAIFIEIIPKDFFDLITTEKHIKKLKKEVKGFDFFYPSKQ